MSELRKDSAGFQGYEYKEVAAYGAYGAMYVDCYLSFGWTMEDRETHPKGRLVLKRDRRIANRMELTRLQRHFEACMEEIMALEKSKTSAASVWALAVGVVGTAFLAGSTFAVVHDPPLVGLSIVLAVPGFLGWILPLFLYRRLVRRRTRTVAELIEQKYDEICDLCAQGKALLD